MSIELENFYSEKKKLIEKNADNIYLQKAKNDFNIESNKAKYSYNFSWMGRPIIAYPQDMIAMQEIIWDIKPDLIIEAGIAHGGSLVYYASLLELIGGDGIVLGLDIDITSLIKCLKYHDDNQDVYLFNKCDLSNCWKETSKQWINYFVTSFVSTGVLSVTIAKLAVKTVMKNTPFSWMTIQTTMSS
jgi:hypothetical protein